MAGALTKAGFQLVYADLTGDAPRNSLNAPLVPERLARQLEINAENNPDASVNIDESKPVRTGDLPNSRTTGLSNANCHQLGGTLAAAGGETAAGTTKASFYGIPGMGRLRRNPGQLRQR